jgi:hypothetical protein
VINLDVEKAGVAAKTSYQASYQEEPYQAGASYQEEPYQGASYQEGAYQVVASDQEAASYLVGALDLNVLASLVVVVLVSYQEELCLVVALYQVQEYHPVSCPEVS